MSSDFNSLLWVWYFQFFISMGGVVSVAFSLTIGVLLTHWLYLCARKIELKPTPLSLPKSILRLSGFQALVAGVVLVPFITISLFYLINDLVWKLAPAMPPTPSADAPSIAGPLTDFDSTKIDEWLSSMASLIIYLAALTALIGGTVFLFLRHYAKRIDPEIVTIGFTKKVVKRYFHDSILVGVLLILIACPVILFFFYNIAWLIMFISPSAVQNLSKIALPHAENLYFRSLAVIGSWLIVVLFLSAFWLLVRGLRLRLRYTMENPTINLIFRRSVKFFSLNLFGYVGCTIMWHLADSFFKIIIQIGFR